MIGARIIETGEKIGDISNYSISRSAPSTSPAGSGGAIPTFKIIASKVGARKHLIQNEDVQLEDRYGNVIDGKVVAYNGSERDQFSIDCNTIFEKLNTEQTVAPSLGEGIWATFFRAFAQCKVFPFRVPGNVRAYASKYIGYVAHAGQYLTATTGAPNRINYNTNDGKPINSITLNSSQPIVFGARFMDNSNEYVEWLTVPNEEGKVDRIRIYANGNSASVAIINDSGSWQTLATVNEAMPDTEYKGYFVIVTAKVLSSGLVEFKIRKYSEGGISSTSTNTSASNFFTKMRKLSYVSMLKVSPTTSAPNIQDAFIGYGEEFPTTFPRTQFENFMPQSVDEYRDVAGFTGNVWEHVKRLCAIHKLDITISNESIIIEPRMYTVHQTQPDGSVKIVTGFREANPAKASLGIKVNSRTRARNVEVVNYDYPAYTGTQTEMWRADTVYSVDRGETFETTVQTDASFRSLVQPTGRTGVPVPYNLPHGSYVIWGNDGYNVSPDWFREHGGSVRVETTSKDGEIKIIIKAPNEDTARAPYRFAEGTGDRPALYVFGYGIKPREKKTIKIATGATSDTAEDVGTTFDSPFVSSTKLAYNVGALIGVEYANPEVAINFSETLLDRRDDEYLHMFGSKMGAVPEVTYVYHEGAYYRPVNINIAPQSVTVSDTEKVTTVGMLNNEYRDMTIGEWNALNRNKPIKDFNVSPLPIYES